jgi:hypothetical protein
MRRIAIAAVALFLVAESACAQEWRAAFVPEKGSRIDFLPRKGGFQRSVDTTAYRLEFVVPLTGDSATVRLIYTGGATEEADDYPAVIVHRGEDMITLILLHTANPPPDKFEIYTLHPRAGVGFSSIVSAYVGNRSMRALAATDPSIPAASASIIPLRQLGR